MLKISVKTKFSEKEKIALRMSLGLVKERLPAKAKILLMSFTGSRAFGWAGDNFDYDIHGLFTYSLSYWDWVHIGISEYDINMYELNHCFQQSIQYRSFEFFSNMANPFYIDRGFDYKGMMELAPRCADKASLIIEMERMKTYPCARSALHVYRLALTSLNLMDRNKFEVDVLKIAPRYGAKMPALLKDVYSSGREGFDLDKTEKELNRLFELHEKKASRLKNNPEQDKIRIKKWIEKMASKFSKNRTAPTFGPYA